MGLEQIALVSLWFGLEHIAWFGALVALSISIRIHVS